MKILIAPDSFKHSLTARQVADNLTKGIMRIFPDATIRKVPVADGGEGTMQSLVDATGGRLISAKVHDPLMRKIDAEFGMLGNGETAVIEMAVASGLELLDEDELDPMAATTYGTGELMKNALDEGCKKMIIGIGGSATNDGGCGMARALGAKFLDDKGNEIDQGGGGLGKLKSIDLSGLDSRLKDCLITVAADVTNPLTGDDGAARVYAPQKGANGEQVNRLEKNMKHFAEVIREQLSEEIEETPGAGAAGGLGAGLIVFAGAKIRAGFEVVSETVKLEEKVKGVDLVITGEGKIDRQTQFGKTPFGVARIAKKFDKPVIAIGGSLGEDHGVLHEKGFDAILPVIPRPMQLKDALRQAPDLLVDAGERMARMIRINQMLRDSGL